MVLSRYQDKIKPVDMTALPWKNLAFAIVCKAQEDYEKALIKKNESRVTECEVFFKSDWCDMLLSENISGRVIMEKTREKTNTPRD